MLNGWNGRWQQREMERQSRTISGTVLGNVPSKSNSYKVVTIHGHGAMAKTAALTAYERSFFLQFSGRGAMIDRPFSLTVDVYYRSNRPDLDNALKVLLDCLQQCKAIKNDRLCTAITARKFVSKERPRAEITITEE